MVMTIRLRKKYVKNSPQRGGQVRCTMLIFRCKMKHTILNMARRLQIDQSCLPGRFTIYVFDKSISSDKQVSSGKSEAGYTPPFFLMESIFISVSRFVDSDTLRKQNKSIFSVIHQLEECHSRQNAVLKYMQLSYCYSFDYLIAPYNAPLKRSRILVIISLYLLR